MITAVATGNGKRIIVLGVTRENLTRLTAGQPIRVSAEHHPGFPQDVVIAVVFGETEADIARELKPLIGAETRVVTVPRDGGTPQ